ncbi:30S ribosomal protein S4 [Striga asiatica]|uniref:30S ribosomal protein S4 n=1 Tax=Striga asiatica TaxID=4170 RepID=A0A5A7Q5U7_STRAF|nr:30S ribosomal protein S4 [Striga asiatica]
MFGVDDNAANDDVTDETVKNDVDDEVAEEIRKEIDDDVETIHSSHAENLVKTGFHDDARQKKVGIEGTGFMTPYHGERYHLSERVGSNETPKNARELFNRRHATIDM